VERLQVLLAGSEVGKGFSELNDPQDQLARFKEQQAMRDAGDDEAQRLDQDYIDAMEYGMPPAFGFGVSERLFAFFENKPVHETQLFPLLRPKQ
jgi:lysyl-tRNA synthetase class 2